MTTTTKTCPECGKEIEITLYEGGPSIDGKAPPDAPFQHPNWCPDCDANIEIDSSDIRQLLDDAEQAAMDWKAEQREDR